MNFIKFDKIVTVNFLDLADNISYVQDHVNSGWIDMISEFLYLGKKKVLTHCIKIHLSQEK